MSTPLANQQVLVFGASRGIGRAIALEFGEKGADVALAARTVTDLESVAQNIDSSTCVVECDISKSKSVDDAVSTVKDSFGKIDTVVHCAGVLARKEVTELSDEQMDWVIDVNLKGTLRIARATIPELKKTDGSLIFLSSIAAEVGVNNLSVYSATKAGMNGLTRQIAIQYADDGIRVNTIAPGTIKTPMNKPVREESSEWEKEREQRVPIGRLGLPEDITGLCTYLASPSSSYVTGQIFTVDGGITSK